MVSNSHDRPVRPVARIDRSKRTSAPVDHRLMAFVKQYAVDHDRNVHVLVDRIFSEWLESVGYLEPFDQEGER